MTRTVGLLDGLGILQDTLQVDAAISDEALVAEATARGWEVDLTGYADSDPVKAGYAVRDLAGLYAYFARLGEPQT